MEYLSPTSFVVIVILHLWELILKGLALWKAGRNNQSGWFVAILLLNTASFVFGIFSKEILRLYYISCSTSKFLKVGDTDLVLNSFHWKGWVANS